MAVYGTQGVAATAKVPGPRLGSVSWIDGSGNLWLFGGYGDISNANPYSFGLLNDLWEFSPTAGKWTWVSGSNTVNAAGVYGTLGTAASVNVPAARSAAGSWIVGNTDTRLYTKIPQHRFRSSAECVRYPQ